MFHPPEVEDAFPGQFTNFYLVKFKKDFPDLGYKKDQEIELEGLNNDFLIDGRKIHKIAKADVIILKKLIKNKQK